MNNENLIIGATLLSEEEVKQIPQDILSIDGWWWLRSPSSRTNSAQYVIDDGGVYQDGSGPILGGAGVRPALHLNVESSDPVSNGTRLKIGNYDFTVVCGGEYALCDTPIGKSVFRKNWRAKDAGDYEESDVKKIVDIWFNENIKDQPVIWH